MNFKYFSFLNKFQEYVSVMLNICYATLSHTHTQPGFGGIVFERSRGDGKKLKRKMKFNKNLLSFFLCKRNGEMKTRIGESDEDEKMAVATAMQNPMRAHTDDDGDGAVVVALMMMMMMVMNTANSNCRHKFNRFNLPAFAGQKCYLISTFEKV